jgi:predicted dehydrogenase
MLYRLHHVNQTQGITMNRNKLKTIRIGVFGAGRMGRRHIEIIREAGLNLCGVFDINPESLKLTSEEQGLSKELLFTDVELLFKIAAPECIIIATTADCHCELTCLAAERGVKYILVEKPMAVSIEECDRMIDICSRNGAKLAVNHHMRYLDQICLPRELIGSNEYGNLSSMTVVAGNFGFAMNATHYFDSFLYLANNEYIIETSAWFSSKEIPNPRGPQFKDQAGSIRAITNMGKRLYLEISDDQGHGISTIYAYQRGMLIVNDLTGDLLYSSREEAYRNLPTTRYAMPSINFQGKIKPAGALDSIKFLLNELINDNKTVTGEDGKRTIELLVSAYKSAENGGIPILTETKLDRTRVFPWA